MVEKRTLVVAILAFNKCIRTNKNAIASFMDAIDDPEEFLVVFQKKRTNKYVQSLYPELVLIFNEMQLFTIEYSKLKECMHS